ncbi:MAG: ABC transporter permease [Vicinamibacterales bacterium]
MATSLALGIGANTAIFSIFDRILLQPLPVSDTASLVNLAAPGPKPGSNSCNQAGDCDVVFSYPMFRDLERAQTVFTGLAAHRIGGANVSARGQTLNTDLVQVSGSYFPTLGVQPALGRLLTPADDTAPGGHPVVVLSHAFWTSQFGADPALLNEPIVVNGTSFTVVGVAARGFEGTTTGARPDLFVPISMREVVSPGWKGFENRRSYWVYVFGRLKPGVSIEQARAALEPVYRGIITDVEAPLQTGMSDQTMARFKTKPLLLEEGGRGQSGVHEEARTPLLMLLAVTTLVLLTACANVANLLLARAAGRAGEMAVRLSIGAGRRQLVTQLLVESCTLAVAGGLAGLLVARWTLALVASFLPPFATGVMPQSLEPRVLLFALAVSIVTGIVFGLYPACTRRAPIW